MLDFNKGFDYLKWQVLFPTRTSKGRIRYLVKYARKRAFYEMEAEGLGKVVWVPERYDWDLIVEKSKFKSNEEFWQILDEKTVKHLKDMIDEINKFGDFK